MTLNECKRKNNVNGHYNAQIGNNMRCTGCASDNDNVRGAFCAMSPDMLFGNLGVVLVSSTILETGEGHF